jgi:hypothetical protein
MYHDCVYNRKSRSRIRFEGRCKEAGEAPPLGVNSIIKLKKGCYTKSPWVTALSLLKSELTMTIVIDIVFFGEH